MSTLTPYPPAVTEQQVRASEEKYSSDKIIGLLLDLGNYLVSLDACSSIFGTVKNDAYSPSLATLLGRLQTGRVALSPLPTLARSVERLRIAMAQRIQGDVAHRPLEDFEDVYYALLARVQDMGHMLSVRVNSGFNSLSEPICINGPTVRNLYDSLLAYWAMLNDPICVRALDDAIRQSRVNILYGEINAELDAGVITAQDAEGLLLDLFEKRDLTEGIAWIGAWSPAMIGAYLGEKYRVAMQVEKEEDERVAEERRRRVAKAKKQVGSLAKRRSVEKMRRGPAKQAHLVQGRNEPLGQMVQGRVGNDQEQVRQERMRCEREWQMRTQRVSEYSSYLRSKASSGARSIIDASAYGGFRKGSMVRGSLGQENAEEDLDVMDV